MNASGRFPLVRASQWLLVAFVVLGTWPGGARLYWVPGIVGGLGVLACLFTAIHLSTLLRHDVNRFFKWLGLMVPVIIACGMLGLAMRETLLASDIVGGRQILRLISMDADRLACVYPIANALRMLTLASTFQVAYLAYFVIQTKDDLHFVLSAMVINGLLLALYGVFAASTDARTILLVYPRLTEDSFSTFLSPISWSAYAALAITAGMALAARQAHLRGLRGFARSSGLWHFLMVLTIAASSFYMEAGTVGRVLHGAPLAVGLLALAVVLVRDSNLRLTDRLTLGLAGLGSAAGLLAYVGNSIVQSKLLAKLDSPLAQDVMRITEERLTLGWGADAFPVIFSIKANADLAITHLAHPDNDWLLALLEHGQVILFFLALGPLLLLGGHVVLRRFTWVSTALITSAVYILLLGAIIAPMRCLGVSFTVLLFLILAVRHGQLTYRQEYYWDDERKTLSLREGVD